jgi:tetratricopeptide (TPR) repeat protein
LSRRFFAATLMILAIATTGVVAAAGPADEAISLTRRLTAAEHQNGPASPALLPILAPLAQLRFEQGELAEATALRRRSLKIAIATDGSASIPAAEAMAALAHLYIERRRYLDAEPLAIAATEVLTERLGPSDKALAPVLADQARIALARGDVDRALKRVEQAIAIDKKGGSTESDRLRIYGTVLVAQAKFAEGERALQEALAIDRTRNDRLTSARSLAALAHAFLRQKRFAEALPLIEEATLLDQTCLGPTHPLIAEDFHDLGLVYLGSDRAADAAKAFHTAIGVLERGDGRGTPSLAYIMLDLAHAEHVQGREDKAQSLFTAARQILNIAEDEERDRQRRA